jgi:hypothetical protein
MRRILLLVLFLVGCAATPTPRDALDGALYARATLDSVYDGALYLRRQGRLDDLGKQRVLDAGARFEVVLRMVEDGRNSEALTCLRLVNLSLQDTGYAPLSDATDCLDAAIQGLTYMKAMVAK